MHGLYPTINATAWVVPFTTVVMSAVEVLQYKVYAVMMPFLGMGRVQVAVNCLGEPGTAVKCLVLLHTGTDMQVIYTLIHP